MDEKPTHTHTHTHTLTDPKYLAHNHTLPVWVKYGFNNSKYVVGLDAGACYASVILDIVRQK